ncbi:MAG: hypothetical protein M9921_14295 [Fimbriimonadaceae bacterium]|nr:hypothetical protein [Chthonomonadaceae bacterium]MCO5298016.1 hypothetical protein [Fimbriimonadaceae bacterium]
MLALLCACALGPVQYRFTPATQHVYDVQVVFDGFIPLLGGQEGLVDLTMSVAVDGLAPDSEGRPRAASEIKAFKLVYNGAALPLTVDNVTPFFPKTTVSMTPGGKVVVTDAPDVQLPVRLPGLHVKRFPDITYLTVEFPDSEPEVGVSWTYTKAFGDSNVETTITPRKIDESVVEMDVAVDQTYTVLEDEGTNVVESEKDAVASVTTHVAGKGRAVFDRTLGAMRSFEVVATATSEVRDLKSGVKTERALKTTLKSVLKTNP